MEQLKAEIARKRKQIEEANLLSDGKKYFKRADLISKHEEEYLKKHAPHKLMINNSSAATSSTSSEKNDFSSSKDKKATSDAAQFENTCEELPKLSRREVIRRLRERGEPVFIFGENETDAFMRLRKMEILEPEKEKGFRNDLQAALEQVDQAYLEEILKTNKSDTGERDRKKLGDVMVIQDDLTYDEIREAAKLSFRKRKDLEGHSKIILQWLKFLLKIWGEQLNARSEDDKLSVRGKLSSATYTQSVEYLKPLLQKLKQASLPDDILESLTEIVSYMLDKEYMKANDSYLEMAIGNAPWPIGVTMVGIHARTGREKIFSKNVAHVMNDESQRKYIQALKRLITKCQYFFPTFPSKSVEFDPNYTVTS